MKSFYSFTIIFIVCAIVVTGTRNAENIKNSSIEFSLPNELNVKDNGNVYSTHRFAVTPGEELEVSTSGGSITVMGTDANEAVVKMYVRRKNRYLSASDTDLRNYEIVIEKKGSKVVAKAKRTSSSTNILNPNNESVSFEVLVPRQFQVDVNTSGGSIRLENLEGKIDGRTSGGSINLGSLTGKVDVRTSGGSITITESMGELNARTSGGSVSATKSSGIINLSTSGGSMRLEELSGEVSASTSGGSIRANIIDLTGDISLRTSGGSITAKLPRGLGLDLELRGNSVRIPLENFSGESKRNQIIGKMNGGGYNVSMRTSGGGVQVDWN